MDATTTAKPVVPVSLDEDTPVSAEQAMHASITGQFSATDLTAAEPISQPPAPPALERRPAKPGTTGTRDRDTDLEDYDPEGLSAEALMHESLTDQYRGSGIHQVPDQVRQAG